LFLGGNKNKFRENEDIIMSFRKNEYFPFALSGLAYIPGGIFTGITFVDKNKLYVENKYAHMTMLTNKYPPVASNS